MKRLILLRHAHAEARDPARADIDRSLSTEGRAAAHRMGKYLAAEALIPDLVICSTARRARGTLESMQAAWDEAPFARFEESLYQAGPKGILALLKTAGEGVGTAMVVGHNPATEELARFLACEGNRDAMRRMATSFPAGSLAVFELPEGDWTDFGAGKAWLRRFVCPRDLEANRSG